ncbi:MAG: hypothetical protein KGZ83_17860 [Sulfuricella sp.]|nr:hypothetical protein [Sulfuricella sp.]
MRRSVQTGPLREYLPEHWRTLLDQQREEWQPMANRDIRAIIQSFNRLRAIEGYYLRNAAVSLAQGIVRASFNGDAIYRSGWRNGIVWFCNHRLGARLLQRMDESLRGALSGRAQ